MDLKGKVAIVTGAGGGIGMQVAKDLASNGCNLVICDRTERHLEKTADMLNGFNIKYEMVGVDFNDIKNLDLIIDRVRNTFGKVHILINCAGVLFNDGVFNVTEEQWDLTVNINLKATFFLDQKVLELMRENEDGYIINFASCVTMGVPPELTTYGASKMGVVGISQALYKEAKKYNVRVTTLHPGMTDTPMLRDAGTGTSPDQWMLPEDLSELIMYLLKSSSRIVIRDIIPLSSKQIIL